MKSRPGWHYSQAECLGADNVVLSSTDAEWMEEADISMLAS